MILNNTPQDQAVLSNVGQIGEFRIRNSAKAFNILSSGLYANKVRAIVRELSCNAVDSHVAAGKSDVPFDVHLPTTLEPYFYIRDYGTGLSHEQVTNIYTTYFESTKTGSNDFIGALGLGSKSPFSYTDNFSVTAIKDGRKGIYTAFINEQGVPSIALMTETETDEPAGVEVKFSVNDRWDFNKFEDETSKVYTWFKLQPKFVGKEITVKKPTFESENIIPGVHSIGDSARSVAIMGNIAYPISVPESDKTLGELRNLLNCGLVIEFDIGELDFQASREGLSYVPQTVESIHKKLVALNNALTGVLSTEANAIDNLWKRSMFLHAKRRTNLWKSAVAKYVADTKFELMSDSQWAHSCTLKVPVSELAKFNIKLRSFVITRHAKTCSMQKESWYETDEKDEHGRFVRALQVELTVGDSVFFVHNDTKVGVTERAKFHWRNKEKREYSEEVHVLEPIDRKQSMNLVAFYNRIYNPPTECRVIASTLDEKDRATGGGIGRNVSILSLEKRGGPSYHSKSSDLVWRDGGKLDQFDDKKTHYYIPLSGFVAKFTKLPAWCGPHDLYGLMQQTQMPEFNVPMYGVRKADIEVIKTKKNWVNLEDHLLEVVKKNLARFNTAAAVSMIDKTAIFNYNIEKIVAGLTNCPLIDEIKSFVNLPDGYHSLGAVRRLMEILKVENNFDPNVLAAKYNTDLKKISKRYPLLKHMSTTTPESEISAYMNLVDSVKTV